MDILKVSVCQADLYWEQIDANLSMFEEMIRFSGDKPDLIVLPEMFTTGFTMNAGQLAEPPGGKTYKWMKMLAAQTKAAILGSYIVLEGKRYFNRAYFVYPNGSSLHYDKKHLFTLTKEDTVFTVGSHRLVVEYKNWRILPQVCYDLRFPVWSRSIRTESNLYEYDLAVYVANWPASRIHAWDTLLKARAIENTAFSIGVNRIGKDGFDKEYPGHSAGYDFKGEELGFSRTTGLLSLELSKPKLEAFRERYPFQKDADRFTLKD